MPKHYVDINRNEFDSFVTDMGFDQDPIVSSTYEISYSQMMANGKYLIRIYSTIVPIADKSREVGRDAIRLIVYVVHKENTRRIFQAVDTQRTTNWKDILRGKLDLINSVWKNADTYLCEKCGGVMVLRRSYQGSKFYGCVEFPRCNHINSIAYYMKQNPL